MSEIDEMASPSLGTNSIKLSTEHLSSLDLHQSIIGDSKTSGINCNKDKLSGSRESSIDRNVEFIEILSRSEDISKTKSAECDNKSWGYYEGDSDEENKSATLKKNESPPSEESPTENGPVFKDTFHTPSSSLQNLVLTDENNEGNVSNMTSNSSPSITYSPINIIGYEQSDQNIDQISLSESLDLPSILIRTHHLNDDLQATHSNSTSDLTQSMESNLSTTSKDSQESSSSMTKSNRDLFMGSVSNRPNKKKMWYHVFSASYKTRSGDFKRIFKELPAEERLVVDYSCALQKEILIQGRMYVSQNYISFYANIFGWETQTSIRLKEVIAISKEKTALVIPNAIQISTDIDKFFFTSFVTRDATHLMLFKLWQTALLDGNLSNKEIWRLVHSSYGDELGVNSEEDDDFLGCDTGSLMSAPSISTLTSEADDNKSIEIDQNQVCANEIASAMAIGAAFVPSAIASSGFGASEQNLLDMDEKEDQNEAHHEHSDLTDTSDSEGETRSGIDIPLIRTPESLDIPLDVPPCPVNHTIGRETVNTIINTDVDTLFTMIFTNSKFYLDLHTERKTFDIVQSQWQQSPEGSQKVRQVSFTVTLNHVMGPKHSQVTETQVMLPESKPGRMYAIDAESVNSGIPYAESFYVTSHICMSRISANESKLCIVNQIKYKKSVWGITKSFIEKNSWAGIEEFYSHLERALKAECENLNAIDQSPMSSPRPNGSGIRRRVQRKKGKAPDVPICTSQIPLNLVRNGSITAGSAVTSMAGINIDASSPKVSDGSTVVKVILSILACLLLLNAFLYIKLSRLETAAASPFSFPPFTPSITKGIPQNHQEWLSLLQQQEALHRIELQKWHEILISALKILQQAESDLESLKFHLTSYSSGKYNIEDFKEKFIKQVEDATDDTDELAPATNFRTESKSDLEQ